MINQNMRIIGVNTINSEKTNKPKIIDMSKIPIPKVIVSPWTDKHI